MRGETKKIANLNENERACTGTWSPISKPQHFNTLDLWIWVNTITSTRFTNY